MALLRGCALSRALLVVMMVVMTVRAAGGTEEAPRFEVTEPYLFGADAVEGDQGAQLRVRGLAVALADGAQTRGLLHYEEKVWVVLAVSHGSLLMTRRQGLAAVLPRTTTHAFAHPAPSVSFLGTVENINKGLASLVYSAPAQWSGDDELTIQVNGANGTLPRVPLRLRAAGSAGKAVLDFETRTNFLDLLVHEDAKQTPLGPDVLHLATPCTDITVTVKSAAGADVHVEGMDQGPFASDAEVNAALATIAYTPPADWNGDDTVDIALEATQGAAMATLVVRVRPASDPPIVSAPALFEATQARESLLLASGEHIQVADADESPSSSQIYAVSLYVANGTLRAWAREGLEVKQVLDDGERFGIELRGPLARLNVALESIGYCSRETFSGTDVLEIRAMDGNGEHAEAVASEIAVSRSPEAGAAQLTQRPGAPWVMAHVAQREGRLALDTVFGVSVTTAAAQPDAHVTVFVSLGARGAERLGATLEFSGPLPYHLEVEKSSHPSVALRGALEHVQAALKVINVAFDATQNTRLAGAALLVTFEAEGGPERSFQIVVDAEPAPPALFFSGGPASRQVEVGLDTLSLPVALAASDGSELAQDETFEIAVRAVGADGSPAVACGTLQLAPQVSSLAPEGVAVTRGNGTTLLTLRGRPSGLGAALKWLQYRVEPDALCAGAAGHLDRLEFEVRGASDVWTAPRRLDIKVLPAIVPLRMDTTAAARAGTLSVPEGDIDAPTAAQPTLQLGDAIVLKQPTESAALDDSAYTIWVRAAFGTIAVGTVPTQVVAVEDEGGRSIILTSKHVALLNATLRELTYRPVPGWSGIETLALHLSQLAPREIQLVTIGQTSVPVHVAPRAQRLSASWQQQSRTARTVVRTAHGTWRVAAWLRGLKLEDNEGFRNAFLSVKDTASSVKLTLAAGSGEDQLIAIDQSRVQGPVQWLNTALDSGRLWCSWEQIERPKSGMIGTRFSLEVYDGDAAHEVEIALAGLVAQHAIRRFTVLVRDEMAPFASMQVNPFMAPPDEPVALPAIRVSATEADLRDAVRLVLEATGGELDTGDGTPASSSLILYDTVEKVNARLAAARFTSSGAEDGSILLTCSDPETGDHVTASFPALIANADAAGAVKFLRGPAHGATPVRAGAETALAGLVPSLVGPRSASLELAVRAGEGSQGVLRVSRLAGLRLLEPAEGHALLFAGPLEKLNEALESLVYIASAQDTSDAIVFSIDASGVNETLSLGIETPASSVAAEGAQDRPASAPVANFARMTWAANEELILEAAEASEVRIDEAGWGLVIDAAQEPVAPVYLSVRTSHGTVLAALEDFDASQVVQVHEQAGEIVLHCSLDQVNQVLASVRVALPAGWNSNLRGEVCFVTASLRTSVNPEDEFDAFEVPVEVVPGESGKASIQAPATLVVPASSDGGEAALSDVVFHFPSTTGLLDVTFRTQVGKVHLPSYLEAMASYTVEVDESTGEAVFQTHLPGVDVRALNAAMRRSVFRRPTGQLSPASLGDAIVVSALEVDVLENGAERQSAQLTVQVDFAGKSSAVSVRAPIRLLRVGPAASSCLIEPLDIDTDGIKETDVVSLAFSARNGSFAAPHGTAWACKSEPQLLQCRVPAHSLDQLLAEGFHYEREPAFSGLVDVALVVSVAGAPKDSAALVGIKVLVDRPPSAYALAFLPATENPFSQHWLASHAASSANEIAVPMPLHVAGPAKSSSVQVRLSLEPQSAARWGLPVRSGLQHLASTVEDGLLLDGSLGVLQQALASLELRVAKPLPFEVRSLVLRAELLSGQDGADAETTATFPIVLPDPSGSDFRVQFEDATCALDHPLVVDFQQTAALPRATLRYVAWWPEPTSHLKARLVARHGTLTSPDAIEPRSGLSIEFVAPSLLELEGLLEQIEYAPMEGFSGRWGHHDGSILGDHGPRAVPDLQEHLELIQVTITQLGEGFHKQAAQVTSGLCHVSVLPANTSTLAWAPGANTTALLRGDEAELVLPSARALHTGGPAAGAKAAVSIAIEATWGALEVDAEVAESNGVAVVTAAGAQSVQLWAPSHDAASTVLQEVVFKRSDWKWSGQVNVTLSIASTEPASKAAHELRLELSVAQRDLVLWDTSEQAGYLIAPSAETQAVAGAGVVMAAPGGHAVLTGGAASAAGLGALGDETHVSLVLESTSGLLWNADREPTVDSVVSVATHSLLVLDPPSNSTSSETAGPATQKLEVSVFEVQRVDVQDAVDAANAVSGSFVLEFDGSTSASIPHDATALQLEVALGDVSSSLGAIAVSREANSNSVSPESYTWLVTFLDYRPGEAPDVLAVNTFDFSRGTTTATAARFEDVPELGGSFRLTLGRATTGYIPSAGPASVIASELQALEPFSLDAKSTIAVSLASEEDGSGSHTWLITFPKDWDVGVLTADSAYLTGEGARAVVTLVSRGNEQRSWGSFALRRGTLQSVPLPVDVTAAALHEALAGLGVALARGRQGLERKRHPFEVETLGSGDDAWVWALEVSDGNEIDVEVVPRTGSVLERQQIWLSSGGRRISVPNVPLAAAASVLPTVAFLPLVGGRARAAIAVALRDGDGAELASASLPVQIPDTDDHAMRAATLVWFLPRPQPRRAFTDFCAPTATGLGSLAGGSSTAFYELVLESKGFGSLRLEDHSEVAVMDGAEAVLSNQQLLAHPADTSMGPGSRTIRVRGTLAALNTALRGVALVADCCGDPGCAWWSAKAQVETIELKEEHQGDWHAWTIETHLATGAMSGSFGVLLLTETLDAEGRVTGTSGPVEVQIDFDASASEVQAALEGAANWPPQTAVLVSASSEPTAQGARVWDVRTFQVGSSPASRLQSLAIGTVALASTAAGSTPGATATARGPVTAAVEQVEIVCGEVRFAAGDAEESIAASFELVDKAPVQVSSKGPLTWSIELGPRGSGRLEPLQCATSAPGFRVLVHETVAAAPAAAGEVHVTVRKLSPTGSVDVLHSVVPVDVTTDPLRDNTRVLQLLPGPDVSQPVVVEAPGPVFVGFSLGAQGALQTEGVAVKCSASAKGAGGTWQVGLGPNGDASMVTAGVKDMDAALKKLTIRASSPRAACVLTVSCSLLAHPEVKAVAAVQVVSQWRAGRPEDIVTVQAPAQIELSAIQVLSLGEHLFLQATDGPFATAQATLEVIAELGRISFQADQAMLGPEDGQVAAALDPRRKALALRGGLHEVIASLAGVTYMCSARGAASDTLTIKLDGAVIAQVPLIIEDPADSILVLGCVSHGCQLRIEEDTVVAFHDVQLSFRQDTKLCPSGTLDLQVFCQYGTLSASETESTAAKVAAPELRWPALALEGAGRVFNSITYAPPADWNGQDTVTVTGMCAQAGGGVVGFSETFDVTVDAVPDRPYLLLDDAVAAAGASLVATADEAQERIVRLGGVVTLVDPDADPAGYCYAGSTAELDLRLIAKAGGLLSGGTEPAAALLGDPVTGSSEILLRGCAKGLSRFLGSLRYTRRSTAPWLWHGDDFVTFSVRRAHDHAADWEEWDGVEVKLSMPPNLARLGPALSPLHSMQGPMATVSLGSEQLLADLMALRVPEAPTGYRGVLQVSLSAELCQLRLAEKPSANVIIDLVSSQRVVFRAMTATAANDVLRHVSLLAVPADSAVLVSPSIRTWERVTASARMVWSHDATKNATESSQVSASRSLEVLLPPELRLPAIRFSRTSPIKLRDALDHWAVELELDPDRSEAHATSVRLGPEPFRLELSSSLGASLTLEEHVPGMWVEPTKSQGTLILAGALEALLRALSNGKVIYRPLASEGGLSALKPDVLRAQLTSSATGSMEKVATIELEQASGLICGLDYVALRHREGKSVHVATGGASKGLGLAVASQTQLGTDPVLVKVAGDAVGPELSGLLHFSETADTSLSILTTIDGLEATINGIAYVPGHAHYGMEHIMVTVTHHPNDPNKAGCIGRTLPQQHVFFRVEPRNSRPLISMEHTHFTSEASQSIRVVGLTVSDADDPAGDGELFDLTLQTSTGLLRMDSLAGLQALDDAVSTGARVVSLSGSLEAMNQALASLWFLAPEGPAGAAVVDVVLRDRGNCCTDESLQDARSFQIAVAAPSANAVQLAVDLPESGVLTVGEDRHLVLHDAVGLSLVGATEELGSHVWSLNVRPGMHSGTVVRLRDGAETSDLRVTTDVPSEGALLVEATMEGLERLFGSDDVLIQPARNWCGWEQLEVQLVPTTSSSGRAPIYRLPLHVQCEDDPILLARADGGEASPVQALEDTPTLLPAVVVTDVDSDVHGCSSAQEMVEVVVSWASPKAHVALQSPVGGVLVTTSPTELRLVACAERLGSALERLVFTPAPDAVGEMRIELRAFRSGEAHVQTASTLVLVLEVEPVNDPPRLTWSSDMAPALRVMQGGDLELPRISVADSDGGAREAYRATLHCSACALRPSTLPGGARMSSNGSGEFEIEGGLVDIRTALDRIVYSPGAQFAGLDRVKVQVEDGSGQVGGTVLLVEVVAENAQAEVKLVVVAPQPISLVANDGAVPMHGLFEIEDADASMSEAQLELTARAPRAGPEVQRIDILQSAQQDVQEVRVVSDTAPGAGPASFTLRLGTAVTGAIDRDAPDMMSREVTPGTSMQAILQQVVPDGVTVEAWRSTLGTYGRLWQVTFHGASSKFPELQLEQETDAGGVVSITTSRTVAVRQPEGTFQLDVAGRLTRPISATESPAGVAQALQALPTVDLVHVTKSEERLWEDFAASWHVTFYRPAGDVPTMRVSTADLTFPTGARVTVTEEERGYGSAQLWRIRTTAKHAEQVQQLRTTATTGPLSGYFQLGLDLSALGGKVAVSGLIDHDALAATSDEWSSHAPGSGPGESMESIVTALLREASAGLETHFRNFDVDALGVRVSRTDEVCSYSCDSVHGLASPDPLCTIDEHCDFCVGRCAGPVAGPMQCISDSDCLGGGGTCSFSRGECLSDGTRCRALEDCSGSGSCQSSACTVDPSGGRTWSITFLNAPHALSMLHVVSDHLVAPDGPRVGMGIHITTPEMHKPVAQSNKVGGFFSLGSIGPIAHDASAEDLKALVAAHVGGMATSLDVLASLPDLEGGREWVIAVRDAPAGLDLTPQGAFLTGTGVQLQVRKVLEPQYAGQPDRRSKAVIRVAGASGLLVSDSHANDDTLSMASVQLRGPVGKLNEALAGRGIISFEPSAGWEGHVRFAATLVSFDGQTHSAELAAAVGWHELLPTLSLNRDVVELTEDAAGLVFAGGASASVSGRLDKVVTLRASVTSGTLWISPAGRLLARSVVDPAADLAWQTPSPALVFVGTVAEATEALTRLSYRGSPNFRGVDRLVLEVDGAATRTVLLHVRSVNDSPGIRIATETVATSEDEPLLVGAACGLEFTSVGFEQDELLRLSVSVAHGSLSVSQEAAVRQEVASGSRFLQVSGLLGDLNGAVVPSLTYTPNGDFFGQDSLAIVLSDGERSHAAMVTIIVEPVNDPPAIHIFKDITTVPEDSVIAVAELIGVEEFDAKPVPAVLRQVVETGAVHVDMQQIVRVTADTGTVSGTFKLQIDLRPLGGALAESEWIDHAAVAAVEDESTTFAPGTHHGESMQAKLDEMLDEASVGLEKHFRGANAPIRVSVSRTDQSCDYACKLIDAAFPAPLCSLDAHCAVCVGKCSSSSARCFSDAGCVGAQTCSFGAGECLSSGTACRGEGDCASYGTCAESNCQSDPSGGFTWTITFHGAPWGLPMLQVAETNLFADSNPVAAVDLIVTRDPPLPLREANRVSGTFSLGGIALDAAVTAEEMEVALGQAIAEGAFAVHHSPRGAFLRELLQQDPAPGVQVTRSLPDLEGGYEWQLLFHSKVLHNVSTSFDDLLLEPEGSGLTGFGVSLAAQIEFEPLQETDLEARLQDTLNVTVCARFGEVELLGAEGAQVPCQTAEMLTSAETSAFLASLFYRPPLNWNSEQAGAFDEVLITVIDNAAEGGVQQAVVEGRALVHVQSQNDAPVITVPGAELDPTLTTEDMLSAVRKEIAPFQAIAAQATPMPGVVVRDVDSQESGDLVEVSLLAINGTVGLLREVACQGLERTGVDVPEVRSSGLEVVMSESLLFRTTVAMANEALDSILFRAAETAGQHGSAALVVVINDQGAHGAGAQDAWLSDRVEIPLAVLPSDAPPKLVGPAKTLECNEDDSVVVDGLHIRYDNAPPDHVLKLRVTASKGTVAFPAEGGVDIVVTDESEKAVGGGSVLHLVGAVEELNKALANTVFTPNLHYHTSFTGPTKVDFEVVAESGAIVARRQVFVHVEAVNDAPILTVPGAHKAYDVNGRYVTVAVDEIAAWEDKQLWIDGIFVSDADAADAFAGPQLVSVRFRATHGSLGLRAYATQKHTARVEVRDAGREMDVVGPLERVNEILRVVLYEAPSDWFGDDEILVQAEDKDGGMDVATIPIHVQAVNDAPVWTFNRDSLVLYEDGEAHVSGVTLSDVDLDAAAQISVQISASLGTVRIGNHDGAGQSFLELNDTLVRVNEALALLRYSPDSHVNAVDGPLGQILFLANDLGGSGSGGFHVTEAALQVTYIVDFNDSPRVLVPGAHFANESGACLHSDGAEYPRSHLDASVYSRCHTIVQVDRIKCQEDTPLNIQGVEVSDVDRQDRTLVVTLAASHGTVRVDPGSEAVLLGEATLPARELRFRCLKRGCNQVLSTLEYKADLNYFGSDMLQVVVQDSDMRVPGRDRTGSRREDRQYIPLDVEQVDDVPVWQGAVAVQTLTTTEDGLLVIAKAPTIYHADEEYGDEAVVVVVVKAQHGLVSLVLDRDPDGDELIPVVFLPEIEALFLAETEPSRVHRASVIAFRATVADANAALAHVTYVPAPDWDSQGSGGGRSELDAVDWFVCDAAVLGGGFAATPPFAAITTSVSNAFDVRTMQIRVEPRKDAPSLVLGSGNPGSFEVSEDGVLELAGLVAHDVDDGALEVSFEAQHGIVSIAQGASVMLAPLTAAGEPVLRLIASSADLESAWTTGALLYRPDPDFNGEDVLSIALRDAGGRDASLEVPVTVHPLNDDPEIHLERTGDGQAVYSLAEGGMRRLAGVEVPAEADRADVVTSAGLGAGFELWRTSAVRPGRKTGAWGLGSGQFVYPDAAWRGSQVVQIGSNTSKLGAAPQFLISAGDVMLFSADDGEHGRELWSSDGTQAGTALVSDLLPGPASSSPSGLHLHDDGLVYFAAHGIDLSWMVTSDACNGFRTVPLSDSLTMGFAVSSSTEFHAFDSYDCPAGFHWASSSEVYALLGDPLAPRGRRPDLDVRVYADECGWSGSTWEGAERLRFRFADSGFTGSYLDSAQRLSSPPLIDPAFATAGLRTDSFAGAVCLSHDMADDGALECLRGGATQACYAESGHELWVTDGSALGTRRVRDLLRGAASSNPSHFASFQGSLFFAASSSAFGNELWRSDGTRGGTHMVLDIRRGLASSNPQYMVANEDDTLLFFAAQNGASGIELWVSDGVAAYSAPEPDIELKPEHTGAGTRMVVDLETGPQGSGPAGLVPLFGSYVVFSAKRAGEGRQVWLSDGSTLGTGRLTLLGGAAGCDPRDLVMFEGKLYFTADDRVLGRELWSVGAGGTFVATRVDGSTFRVGPDGTAVGGATLVKDVHKGVLGSGASHLSVATPLHAAAVPDQVPTLFFFADNALWRSDGTGPGTMRAFPSTKEELEPYRSDLLGGTRALVPHGEGLFVGARRAGPAPSEPSRVRAVGAVLQALRLTDVDDAPGATYELRLSCSKGELALDGRSSDALITTTLPDGLLLEGTLTELNQAVEAMVFRAKAKANGPDQIVVEIQDAQGARTEKRMDVMIEPVNDAPEVSAPASAALQAAGRDQLLGPVEVTDDCDESYSQVGAGIAAVSLEVQVTAKRGDLSVLALDSVRMSTDRGSSVVFSGPLAGINEALATLRYDGPCSMGDASRCSGGSATTTEDDEEGGEDEVTVRVNDNGNFGRGGAQETTVTIAISLT